MRARFYIFLPLLFVLTFFGVVRSAIAYDGKVPCYCRYGANHPDFQSQNAGADAARSCPNEVYWIDQVPAPNLPVALANCTQACVNAGSQFVGITSFPPDKWATESFTSSTDLVQKEQNVCVFSAFQSPPKPISWRPENAGCGVPLNTRIGQQACSYCRCKFKSGAGQNAACAGKTTMLKLTGDPTKCEALCAASNLDPAGPGTKNFDDACNYTLQDGCAKPVNPSSDICKSELAAQTAAAASAASAASAAAFQAGKGSPLALLLPFGDISLPKLIARIIRQVMGVVGAIAFVYFIWGGIQYMTAAGDDKKIGMAKATIIAATSGLVAIFLSYAVLTLIINAIK